MKNEKLCNYIRNLIPWILIFLLIIYGQITTYKQLSKHSLWLRTTIDYLNQQNLTFSDREKEIWTSLFKNNPNLQVPPNFLPFISKPMIFKNMENVNADTNKISATNTN